MLDTGSIPVYSTNFIGAFMKNRKKVARRNRYFTTNVGNENSKFCSFSAWKKRERATAKEELNN
tara:strand:+ start:602 stop:793 length:192 start_codon:yes stop_codon:yes gene_type:complete